MRWKCNERGLMVINRLSILVIFQFVFFNAQLVYAEPEKRIINARTLCLNKAKSNPDIFIDGTERQYKILLPVQMFSGGFECVLEDDVAIFYKEEGMLPNGVPKRVIVAQTKVKSNVSKVLFFFDASSKKGDKLYRVIAIDDSFRTFSLGQARILNLFKTDLDINLGEHRRRLKSGNLLIMPSVKKKNSSNMVNVVGKIKVNDQGWTTFSEFRTKITKDVRIFMIAHYDTFSKQPKIKIYRDIPITNEPGEFPSEP